MKQRAKAEFGEIHYIVQDMRVHTVDIVFWQIPTLLGDCVLFLTEA